MTIQQILSDIGEDKNQNLSTTSYKFKQDVWEFFQGFEDRVAVELGTNKGQTTKLLSYLFSSIISTSWF